MYVSIKNLSSPSIINRTRGIINKLCSKMLYDGNLIQEYETTINDLNTAIVDLRGQLAGEKALGSLDKTKILILGSGYMSISIIYGIAKCYGYEKDRIEVHNDYDKNKHFDIRKLQYSTEYKSVFIGPVAHKIVGLGNYDSIIEKIQSEQGYPPFQILKAKSGDLKITKTSLKNAFDNLMHQKMAA